MSKFNTISLDAADTLFYIKKGLGDTYNGVLKKYADNYDSKNISASFKKHFSNRKGLSFQGLSGDKLYSAERDWWHCLVKDMFSELGMFDRFEDYFDDLYNHFKFDAWEIYDDTIPFLKELKNRNYKIIITSNFDSRIYNVCDGFGISEYIDYFTISSKSGCAKPTKEFFMKSLKNSNSNIENTIHVGDNPELDYKAEKKIGLKAFLIDRENKSNEQYIIDSLISLLGKI